MRKFPFNMPKLRKKDMSNPHLDAGIADLGKAIAAGKAGDAGTAYKHANSAVMHLKEIK